MTDKLPAIELHISPNMYVKNGEAHLVCAFKDWKAMSAHFKQHFELWSPTYTEDSIGLAPTWFKVKVWPPAEPESHAPKG